MKDRYRRDINYLRVSVTDRCNLRCVYCMPPEGVKPAPHGEVLTFEEIEMVVRAAASIGVKKVRLTGGEPLVRRGLEELVRRLSGIPGIDDLALTTNGVMLAEKARALKEAGLKRVNISLDSLVPERYREITRGGDLSLVLAGVQAALEEGLHPVKINTVVIRGFNEDEVVGIARLTENQPLHVRFIELMPIGSLVGDWTAGRFVAAADIIGVLSAELGTLVPAKEPKGGGPAKYYRLRGAAGTVGFITSMSEHFCQECNRLRLTSTGGLRPCLYDGREFDLRAPLRRGADVEEIAGLIEAAVAAKPDRHHLLDGWRDRRVMSQLGG